MSAIAVFLQLGGCAVVIVGVMSGLVFWLRAGDPRADRPRRAGPGSGGLPVEEPPGGAPNCRSHGADAVFWNCFVAVALLLPCLLIPAIHSPVAGAGMSALAIAAAAAAYRGAPAVNGFRCRRRDLRAVQRSYIPAMARHEAVLARWRRYELEVGNLIDFPAMSDVKKPETALLFRSMREADVHRAAADGEYAPAVRRLELALAAAERAAGVTGRRDCPLEGVPQG